MNKSIRKFVLGLCLVTSSVMGYGQSVGINNSGIAPNPSAMLDLNSTRLGMLVPRMTTAQMNAIVTPATALLVYNTTVNCFEWWTGSNWQVYACICIGPPASPATPTGTVTVCAGATGVSYTITPVPGAVSYNWTVPPGATIATGQGTTAITVNFGNTSGNVCVSSVNTCGSSAPSCLAVNVTNIPAAPGPITGPISPPKNSLNNVYSIAPVPGATGYTWSIAPVIAGTSIQSGQGTPTINVAFANTIQTYTICVFASNACGNSPTTCLVVTTVNCAPLIALDAVSGANPVQTTSITITTTQPNEIIAIAAEGDTYSWAWPSCTVGVTGPVSGAATYINWCQGEYGGIAMFAFAAPVAGLYTINVNEGNYSLSYYMNFAASFDGFCSTPPTVASNVAPFAIDSIISSCLPTLSITGNTTIAYSLIFTGMGETSCGVNVPVTWTNATGLGQLYESCCEVGANAYTQCPTIGAYTITCNETNHEYTGMAGIVIHP